MSNTIKQIKQIALIGAGNVGSRHLQALAKIDFPVVIQVVDCNKNSLKNAQARYLEIPENQNVQRIDFLMDIDQLNANLDLVIIATNSDVRIKVVRELLAKKLVSNLILEKVAFQSKEQFEVAKELIMKNKISCWVNCAMRLNPVYQELKKNFKEHSKIEMRVSGCNWGLACNGIHYVDLLSFFISNSIYKLNVSKLESRLWESKRRGFIELTGRLEAVFSEGSRIALECSAGENISAYVSINAQTFRLGFDELSGFGKIAQENDGWQEKKFVFKALFQSDLTHIVAKEILESGTCKLTGFDESFVLHQPFLEAIMRHLEKVERRKYICCPIT